VKFCLTRSFAALAIVGAVTLFPGCGLFTPAQAPHTRADIDAVVNVLDAAVGAAAGACDLATGEHAPVALSADPKKAAISNAQCIVDLDAAVHAITAARQAIAVYDASQTQSWACAVLKAADAVQTLGSLLQALGQTVPAEIAKGLAMADRILADGSCPTAAIAPHALAAKGK
jgi:hypothetical protein